MAAELYERAFALDPSADAAPEAALNGAHAFKQAGQWDRALDLYRLFLAKFPAPERIAELKKKDPSKRPGSHSPDERATSPKSDCHLRPKAEDPKPSPRPTAHLGMPLSPPPKGVAPPLPATPPLRR